jgi:hypothetical protein
MICLNQATYSGKESPPASSKMCGANATPVRAYVTFIQNSGNMCKVLDKGQPRGWALL